MSEESSRLFGAYQVLGTIGEGGMGVVIRASSKGREVAIKILRSTAGHEGLQRFEREAKLLRELGEDAGFVSIVECLAAPQPAIVMPFMKGGTLRDRLDRGPLDASEAIALVVRLCNTIAGAHERGIVHRDLKPENILFGAGGRPLIADLGLAKYFQCAPSSGVSLSIDGQFLGSFGFAAPEQMKDARSAGPPADIFALGAILYECLTEKPPYMRDGPLSYVGLALAGQLEPVRSLRPDVPAWLEAAVHRALAPDPAARFADARAFARALEGREPPAPRGGLGYILAGALGAVASAALVVGLGAVRASRLTSPAAPPPPLPGSPPPLAGSPPSAPVAPSPPPAVSTERSRGWLGEELPPGLRRGAAAPVLLWDMPGQAGTLELVHVPAGEYVLGTDDAGPGPVTIPNPTRRVRLVRGFWIGRASITWRQFLDFCQQKYATAPARPAWGADDHPVVNVAWSEAKAFCEWASLALPTDAEWEMAARGTDARLYPWGNPWDPSRLNFADRNAPELYENQKLVWRELGADDGFSYTSPGGSFPRGASPCGALDMAGDVWNWTDDAQEVPQKIPARLVRGSCWWSARLLCRSDRRLVYAQAVRDTGLGFRVLLR